MIMTDVNVIWHNEDDVEVTNFFNFLYLNQKTQKDLY